MVNKGNDGLLDRSGYRMYYPYTDTYKTSYNEATKEFTNQIAYKGNANLTWEKSGELNLGVDFSLFKHRLNGTLEVFNKKDVRPPVLEDITAFFWYFCDQLSCEHWCYEQQRI